jgi:aspartate/methionine/tyrosine aminotransferase
MPDSPTALAAATAAAPLPLRPEVAEMEESRIVEVWKLGFERDDVIGLWVGEGDQPTPDFISDPAIAALKGGSTFYSMKRGLPALRRALSDYSAALYGHRPDESRVTLTQSGMNAMVVVLQAFLRPGDKVAIVSPIWPNIVSAVRLMGGEPVQVSLDHAADGTFHLDMDKLEEVLKGGVRALFVATPSNPTGWMLDEAGIAEVLALTRKYGVWLMADEVYNRFTYERPFAPSFLSQAEPEEPVIAINSFSKAWAMTGWRLGWVVHPPMLGDVLDKIIEFNTSGAQSFLQYGAIAALEQGEPFVAEMVERCRRGRDLVYQGLSDLPRVTLDQPPGAFYSFFKVAGVEDSLAFAKRLVHEAGVGLAPGSAFGPGGEGHLRLCFASSEARISQALDRMRPLLS